MLRKKRGVYSSKIIGQSEELKGEFEKGILFEKRIFSQRDTTNWSDKLYTFTNIFKDTIPSYHMKNLPERH